MAKVGCVKDMQQLTYLLKGAPAQHSREPLMTGFESRLRVYGVLRLRTNPSTYICDTTDKGGLMQSQLQIHLVYVCSEDVDSHTHTQSSMA